MLILGPSPSYQDDRTLASARIRHPVLARSSVHPVAGMGKFTIFVSQLQQHFNHLQNKGSYSDPIKASRSPY